MARCTARTKNGTRCQNQALAGKNGCRQHPDAPATVSTGTRTTPRRQAPNPAARNTNARSTNPEPTPSSYPDWLIPLLALALAFLVIVLVFIALRSNPSALPPSGRTPTPAVALTTPAPAAAPAAASAAPAAANNYGLSGIVYSSPQGHEYDARWESNGRLWQPSLPLGNLRVAHSVSGTILPGNYTFNGVSCRLYVDNARNGKGSSNPLTAGGANGVPFTVTTADNGNAFMLIECDGGASSGFEIVKR